MARAEGIHTDLDAELNFARQAALAEGFRKKEDVQILAGLGERPQRLPRPSTNCGSAIPRWFCCREVAFQLQLCGSVMRRILVECRESREEIKRKLRKLVNVWFFEPVQYGKSSWTVLGLPRVLNHAFLILRFFSNLNGQNACVVYGLRFRNNQVWTAH